MLYWQQSRCGTKKAWISIMVDQIPSIHWPEISLKWSGETQPSLVWVLLDLTPGTIILNIFILRSWFSSKYLADINYFHILWADRYTWKLRSYVMNSHVHVKCQNYSISIIQSWTETTCNWSFFLEEIIFCWLGSGIIFFFSGCLLLLDIQMQEIDQITFLVTLRHWFRRSSVWIYHFLQKRIQKEDLLLKNLQDNLKLDS